jgi:hypothetical protein
VASGKHINTDDSSAGDRNKLSASLHNLANAETPSSSTANTNRSPDRNCSWIRRFEKDSDRPWRGARENQGDDTCCCDFRLAIKSTRYLGKNLTKGH